MLDSLKEIINPEVILSISMDDHSLLVKEDGFGSKIKKLKILSVPADSLAFTLDFKSNVNKFCFKQLSCYVNPKNGCGVNKGCDLVLISVKEGKCIIYIIDLKSGRIKKKQSELQLLNSKLYVQYLFSMLHAFYGKAFKNIIFKHVIVTSDNRNVKKAPVYSAKFTKISDTLYRNKVVTVKNGEARIHFGAL